MCKQSLLSLSTLASWEENYICFGQEWHRQRPASSKYLTIVLFWLCRVADAELVETEKINCRFCNEIKELSGSSPSCKASSIISSPNRCTSSTWKQSTVFLKSEQSQEISKFPSVFSIRKTCRNCPFLSTHLCGYQSCKTKHRSVNLACERSL